MSSPFASAISGKDRSLLVTEDESFVAILESRPLVLGHVVVVPRREEDHLFDLTEEELQAMMAFARPIAHAIRAAVPCEKVGMAALGLVTRHAHLHLVPISAADDLNFAREKIAPPPEALSQVLARLRAALGTV